MLISLSAQLFWNPNAENFGLYFTYKTASQDTHFKTITNFVFVLGEWGSKLVGKVGETPAHSRW